jgi:FKBP-type peptidyl-prolyl cis-trans isomerase
MEDRTEKISFNWKNIGIVASFMIIFAIAIGVISSLNLNFSNENNSDEILNFDEVDVNELEGGGDQMDDLKVEVLEEGTGDEAKDGDEVTVNYKGTLEDGSVFDSSYERGEPFTFTLGQGQVIEGWDKGLVGMKVGGKRKLTIPPEMAYGEKGAGSDIPPNSTLIFEVELLAIK